MARIAVPVEGSVDAYETDKMLLGLSWVECVDFPARLAIWKCRIGI
jgi:hypothetical protein